VLVFSWCYRGCGGDGVKLGINEKLELDYQVFYGRTDSEPPNVCPVRNIENQRRIRLFALPGVKKIKLFEEQRRSS